MNTNATSVNYFFINQINELINKYSKMMNTQNGKMSSSTNLYTNTSTKSTLNTKYFFEETTIKPKISKIK